MSKGSLIDWKNESEAIHREMNHLFAAGWLETAAERRVRMLQFMALIERRDAAARKFLHSNRLVKSRPAALNGDPPAS
jgi:hypothetical protein